LQGVVVLARLAVEAVQVVIEPRLELQVVVHRLKVH
jgi:hypothetical protein